MKPLIRFPGEWQRLTGCAFGLPQATTFGTVLVGEEASMYAGDVARAFCTLFEDTLPMPPPAAAPAESIAWLLAAACVAIQREARISASEKFHVRPLPAPDSDYSAFEVAIASGGPRNGAAAAAIRWARDCVAALVASEFDPEAARASARQELQPFADPGVNAFLIVRAAHELQVPVIHWSNFLVLGTGIHTRWMKSTISDATSSIGVTAAKKKHLTAWLLRSAGLPGGENVLVDSKQAALAAARQIGFPVVVKPDDRDKGEGVNADLRDEAAVSAAYDEAAKFSRNILVERWFPGFTHRLNVFQGRVNRVSRRIAGGVVGDGISDIGKLVAMAQQTAWNKRMRRTFGRELLSVDDEALDILRGRGLDAAYVPAEGEYVRMRRRDNMNAGARSDELDASDPAQVHPDNVRLAIDAARALRLDIAGVDLIMQDISRSWLETGALICEVNAQPQITVERVVKEMVRDLAGPQLGRIPAQLHVTPAANRQQLAEQLARSGEWHGVSDAGGLRVDGRRVTQPFNSGFAAARALLMRTDVGSAACVMTAHEVARSGLPLDRWDAVHVCDAALVEAQERESLALARRIIGNRPD